ncbi:Chaperone protein EcpD precursor [compost metagenome]|uniref:Chaperone protein LpfB n=1 Tax=Pseudomonas wadenswilerensis TaxID=1785161 RepID=A0A380SZW1_9PSED|nr:MULTISPECIES: molecular chaperone [Pseudomonas]UVM19910.1 molecular chaperone [Pseudomonas wadenswilerensis]SPO66225.1 Pilus assembly protein [Pseudomonas sp. JV241A]SUQ63529.1 Chaperone protein LpfB [Pseudomonas wadenswilerensis]
MLVRQPLSFCLGILGMLAVAQASAGISLSGTRLVFDGKHKEAGITVRNTGDDVLIQSWVDSDGPDSTPVPFAVTPPLARVTGNEQQLLRVIYEGTGMPSDKESVVWLNVQEIPQAAKTENTLQLAVRQRIKVFFRPSGLTANAYLAPTELQWQLRERAGKTVLGIDNPGLYHVSMGDIKLQSGQSTEIVVDSMMIAPGEHKELAVKQLNAAGTANLSFTSINDYGAQEHYTTQLVNATATKASLTKASP